MRPFLQKVVPEGPPDGKSRLKWLHSGHHLGGRFHEILRFRGADFMKFSDFGVDYAQGGCLGAWLGTGVAKSRVLGSKPSL